MVLEISNPMKRMGGVEDHEITLSITSKGIYKIHTQQSFKLPKFVMSIQVAIEHPEKIK